MAKILDNDLGRRMIRLSTDDIMSIVQVYQEKCNCQNYTYDEIRSIINSEEFYLPEDV